MPLTLITGPANSEKAGAVLDPFRAAIDRGAILVVPTFGDAERLRRDFAQEHRVFGVRIEQFAGLLDEVARRTEVRPYPLGDHARRRVLAMAVAARPLEQLADAATTTGFVGALEQLTDELRALRVTPARFAQALGAWAGEDRRRVRYAAELAGLYAAYRRQLERLRREDRAGYRAAALDALRRTPGRWGAGPVCVYGFDDLTAQQLDALDALRRATDVTVSLSFEPGRRAFAARAEVAHDLRAVADAHRELPPNAEHYAPAARDALHHLERELFEEREHALFATATAGDAIELLEGGGERAELELVAAAVARLLREDGVAPDEIALVLRKIDDVAPLVEQVFAAHGVPIAIERQVALGRVPIGRAILGWLRAALLDGDAADLLTWLRAPGVIRSTGALDDLEREIRSTGARSAADARAVWERDRFVLHELDRVTAAAARGGRALCDAIAAELMRLLELPHRAAGEEGARGTAPILTADEAVDAAACRAARRTLDEIAALAERHPSLAPSPAELVRALEDVQVRAGTGETPGAVAITDPLTIRARRVRVLFVCRLQEGIFPRAVRPPALLDDEDRRELARTAGLILPRRDDELAAERHLFYAVASRPQERLVLSWHLADDEGRPAVRSFLVDEVLALFGDDLPARTRRRELGAVGGEGGADGREALRRTASLAPREREAPIGPLRDPALLAELAGREAISASDLEAWAACPVRWFVGRALKADDLEATPEALARGQLAHAALEAVVQALGAGTTDARLTADKLPRLRELVREALAAGARDTALSTDAARIGILSRRLERDLLRYVEHAAAVGTAFVPTYTEVAFGDPRADGDGPRTPPLTLAPGVAVRGRIDRVDVAPDGRAVVYDYKGRVARPHVKWVEEGRFQVAIYALAARELLGLDVVGGLYQPLAGDDLRGRGVLRDDPDLGIDVVKNDVVDADTLDAVLQEVVVEAVRVVAELRAGALRPQPLTCGVGASTGCQYPTICRCEA